MKIEFANYNSKLYGELGSGQVFSKVAPNEDRNSDDIYLNCYSEKGIAIRLTDGCQEEFENWEEVYPLDVTLVIK